MKKGRLILTLAAGMAACSGVTPFGGSRGALELQLTSTPFPDDSVARVDIHVVRLEAMRRAIDSSEAANAADAGDNEDPERGFITLAVPGQSYELVSFQDGRTQLLGNADILLGDYAGFRMILDPAQSSITLLDGTVLTSSSDPGIEWPDAERVGVKITLDAPITMNELDPNILIVDFDMRRAFAVQGSSISESGVRFLPVIRGVIRDSTGSLAGTVRLDGPAGNPVGGARIEVLKPFTPVGDTDAANIVRAGFADASGAFDIRFLARGVYNIRAFPPKSLASYQPGLIEILTVAPSTRADGNVLILPPS